MRLKITHQTEYKYDTPVRYVLQRIRLFAISSPTQTVLSWSLAIENAKEELRFNDHFGNDTRLLSANGGSNEIVIEARGEVETINKAGVSGPHKGFAPLWLFQQETPLTAAGDGVNALAKSVGKGTDLDRLHGLMGTIGEKVAYVIGATGSATPAETSLAQGSGVCQDHAHIFISAARRLGFPARYVSGYLLMEGQTEQVASHAWAEAHVDGLGWVAFDAANGISPDENYVRLATGRDYREAMPVSGIRLGQAEEQLAVRITVEQ